MSATTKPRLLTDEQLEELGQEREQGATQGRLVQLAKLRFDVEISAKAILWQLLRLGYDLPPGRRQATNVGPLIQQRGDQIVRRFSPEDDKLLLELERQQLSYSEIGRRMSRKPNSIRGRLLTLARRDARQDEAA